METLLLIDGNSILYRSYFALPDLTDAEGAPAGALYGFASALIRVLREHGVRYAAVAYDRPERTFREEEFPAYKGTRRETPGDLVSQIEESKKIGEALGMKTFEAAGYEADDIIATLVERFRSDEKVRLAILSGDHDALQLVEGDEIVVWMPQSGGRYAVYDEEAVRERFGVPPERIPDYKGLVGDTSDNIPGVRGVGPKAAARIVREFGSLEEFYELGPKPDQPLMRRLIEGRESALLSKRLATMRRDVPIEIPDRRDLELRDSGDPLFVAYLEGKGFASLVHRVGR